MASHGPERMREFTPAQLADSAGDVLAAAAQAPVRIGRPGQARFVLLTAERFEALVRGQGGPRAGDGRRKGLLAHARAAQARLAGDPAEARRLAEAMEVAAENPVEG